MTKDNFKALVEANIYLERTVDQMKQHGFRFNSRSTTEAHLTNVISALQDIIIDEAPRLKPDDDTSEK